MPYLAAQVANSAATAVLAKHNTLQNTTKVGLTDAIHPLRLSPFGAQALKRCA